MAQITAQPLKKKKKRATTVTPVVRPDAAGIDLGATCTCTT
jgi:hypothetical protein